MSAQSPETADEHRRMMAKYFATSFAS